VKREPVAASNIVVGLQCGGSDAIPAPRAGARRAVDMLVRHGGTAILSRARDLRRRALLTRRAVSRAVGQLIERIGGGRLHRAREGRDEQQPVAGQQGGRPRRSSRKSSAQGGTTNLVDVYNTRST
jgi:altronate hydrolase